jgi:type I restriction enzyme R subunit
VDTPEARARAQIDRLLHAAGWAVQDLAAAQLNAACGIAIREFPLAAGHGLADYLLYVDGRACGVIEAKKHGATLSGVESHFTNRLDPRPRAHAVFAFHRPEMLAQWLQLLPAPTVLSTGNGADAHAAQTAPATVLARLQAMPELVTAWGDFKLWPAQIQAVRNLEMSLAADKLRALIQMATGSGKTFSVIYRLIRFAGFRRVLFLVDRGNLGRQTKKEFDAYASTPANVYRNSAISESKPASVH